MSVTVGELKLALATSAEKMLNASGRLRMDKLSVSFRGKTAAAAYRITGNKVEASVNFPYIRDEQRVSRGEADRMTGYTIHELGHILFTDFLTFKEYAKKGQLHKMILNGIEDARMERCVVKAGWVGNARRCLEVLIASLTLEAFQSGYDPNDSSNIAFTLAILGRDACGLKVEGVERVWAKLSPKNREWMKSAVAKIAKLPGGYEGTEAAARLADELIDSLPKQPKPQPQPKPQEQAKEPQIFPDDESDEDDQEEAGDESGESLESTDEEDEDGEDDSEFGINESDEEAQADDDDSAPDALPDDDSDDGDSDDEGAGKPEGKPEQGDAESGEAEDAPATDASGDGFSLADAQQQKNPEVNGDMDKLAEKHNEGKQETQADLASQQYTRPTPHTPVARGSEMEFKESVARTGSFGALKAKLAQILVSPDEGGWEERQTSGRFDARRVSAAKSSREDVFQRRWEKDGYETAVLMMIDLSGSMGSGEGSRRHRAQQVACAFAECFDKLNVSFECYGYTTGGDGGAVHLEGDDSLHGSEERYCRDHHSYSGAYISTFKARNDSMQDARKRLSGISKGSGSGTPDYDAVRFAIETMITLPHRRKIVFNITDGAGCGVNAMKSLVAMGKLRNVDLIGIGIGRSANLTGQYDVHATVANTATLAKECFAALVRQFQKYQEKLGREVL